MISLHTQLELVASWVLLFGFLMNMVRIMCLPCALSAVNNDVLKYLATCIDLLAKCKICQPACKKAPIVHSSTSVNRCVILNHIHDHIKRPIQ